MNMYKETSILYFMEVHYKNVHNTFINHTPKLQPTQTQTHYMNFENVSRNRFTKRVWKYFTSTYILIDNFGSFANWMAAVLSDINSWSEYEILEKTP